MTDIVLQSGINLQDFAFIGWYLRLLERDSIRLLSLSQSELGLLTEWMDYITALIILDVLLVALVLPDQWVGR